MSDVFEYHFTVGDRDADGFGLCRASALLGYLQDAAAGAAENGGFGRRALLEKYGAFWMLARTWFRLERPLRWGEELTVRTWHRGAHGAMMYRDYDILSGSEPVGESVSGWVLAQQESRRLLRLGAVGEMAANQGGELCKAVTLAKLRRPEDLRLGAPGAGSLDGVVTHLIFKGVHYEMEVLAGGFEWLVQSTKCWPVGMKVSLAVDPFDIQIMHKPESEDEEAMVIDA